MLNSSSSDFNALPNNEPRSLVMTFSSRLRLIGGKIFGDRRVLA